MPIDAVKIPQNVQIEDKVVGPLSLRQIIIMALGGGFSYMIYASVQKSMGYVGIPLTIVIWIPAVIAAAFAMVNINDLSLLRILFLLLERTQKPGKRIWAPRSGISITIRTSSIKEEAPKAAADAGKPSASQQIAELSSVVDRASPVAPSIDAVTASATATVSDLPTVAPAGTEVGPDPVPVPEPVPPPKPPVNPEHIQVDSPVASATPQLSDLSVFRDIFPVRPDGHPGGPPKTPWQS